MANLSAAAKTLLATDLLGLIEADATAADFRLFTAAFATLLWAVDLQEPSFAEAAGVLTLDVTPALTGTAAASGNAAVWEIRDGNGTRVIDGDIGTGAEDLDIDVAAITVGQVMNLNSLVITFV